MMAAMTCAAVEVISPPGPVARRTVIALPATSTRSGEFVDIGFTSCAVIWLPPSWPQAFEVSTIARSPLAALSEAVLPLGRLLASKVTYEACW